ALLVPLASLSLFVPALGDATIVWPGVSGPLWGPSVVRSDTLASVLIPMVAALWLVTLAITPRCRLDGVGIRRTAVTTLITIAVFSTVSPVLLALLWVGSSVPYLLALSAPAYRR